MKTGFIEVKLVEIQPGTEYIHANYPGPGVYYNTLTNQWAIFTGDMVTIVYFFPDIPFADNPAARPQPAPADNDVGPSVPVLDVTRMLAVALHTGAAQTFISNDRAIHIGLKK